MAPATSVPVSEHITRKSASNLALAFILLPKPKRAAMAALYAFCREVDDIADDEARPVEERRQLLQQWREDLQAIYNGGRATLPVNRELAPFIQRYALPFDLFHELILGVEMDLDQNRYRTWEDLELYCYRVASVVGLLSIEVFEYGDKRCREYAIELGKALQLTNILRDVKVDAEKGRIYLPLEEMERAGVTEEDILAGKYSDRYYKLASAVAERARKHYRNARTALPAADRSAMASAELMGTVYWRLFQKLEAQRFDVFAASKTRLTKPHKIFLILRTWFRMWRGVVTPNYGGA